MGKPNFEQKASRDSDRKFKQPKNPLFVYQTVARIISAALRQEGSLRKLVYENATSLVKTHLSLAIGVARHRTVLESLVNETGLAEQEDISPELAQVLVYELLLGARSELPEGIEIFDRVSSYRDQLEAALSRIKDSGEFDKLVITEVQAVIPRYGRVNTLLTTLENVVADLQKHGFTLLDLEGKSYEEFLEYVSALKDKEFVLDFHFPQDLLVFNPKQFLAKLQVYRAGHLILHDKTSYFPVACLGAPPGSVVLDACAAPGMKTVHLAARMNNQGTIFALDKDIRNLEYLEKNLNTYGVHCCQAEYFDFLSVNPDSKPFCDVEYILLDVPSSHTGNRPEYLSAAQDDNTNNSNRVRTLSGFQRKLLYHALEFPNAKRIVYITTSTNREENEEVIDQVLRNNPEKFKLARAFPEWHLRGDSEFAFSKFCVRTQPLADLTIGSFMAVLERIKNGPEPVPSVSKRSTDLVEKTSFDLVIDRVGLRDITAKDQMCEEVTSAVKEMPQQCNSTSKKNMQGEHHEQGTREGTQQTHDMVKKSDADHSAVEFTPMEQQNLALMSERVTECKQIMSKTKKIMKRYAKQTTSTCLQVRQCRQIMRHISILQSFHKNSIQWLHFIKKRGPNWNLWLTDEKPKENSKKKKKKLKVKILQKGRSIEDKLARCLKLQNQLDRLTKLLQNNEQEDVKNDALGQERSVGLSSPGSIGLKEETVPMNHSDENQKARRKKSLQKRSLKSRENPNLKKKKKILGNTEDCLHPDKKKKKSGLKGKRLQEGTAGLLGRKRTKLQKKGNDVKKQ